MVFEESCDIWSVILEEYTSNNESCGHVHEVRDQTSRTGRDAPKLRNRETSSCRNGLKKNVCIRLFIIC